MARTDRIQTEQEHHRRAFEVYNAQGGRRSYQAVAQEMGVSASTVKLWSHSFGWRQRIKERDLDTARQIADKTLESDIADHTKHRKLVRMALVKVAKAVLDGRVRITIADLDRLIRLESILGGLTIPTSQASSPDPLEQFDNFQAQLQTLSLQQLRQLSQRWGVSLDRDDVPRAPVHPAQDDVL